MNNENIETLLKNGLKYFTINTSLQQRSVADIIEYECCNYTLSIKYYLLKRY